MAADFHVVAAANSGGTPPDQLGDWLDRAALQRLADVTSIDVVPKLINILTSELRDQRAAIEAAAMTADIASLASESHVMKSSAAAFGLPRINAVAGQLNAACKANQSNNAIALAADLVAQINPSIHALERRYGLGIEAAE